VQLSYTEKPAVSGSPAENKVMVIFNLLGVTSVGTQ